MSASRAEVQIFSKRRSELLDGLSAISADTTTPPSGDVLQRLLSLLKANDAGVREAAILAVGTHWGAPDAFPVIVGMLEGAEQDPAVLEAASTAVGAYASTRPEYRIRSLRALARVALRPDFDPELRAIAYLNAAHAAGLIDVREFAKKSAAAMGIDELSPDWGWLQATANV